MSKSIPASQIVQVNPSVLSGGGSPLSMNAVFLTANTNVPIGEAMAFASADSVGEFFGETSQEYLAAQKYFLGFDGSHIKPSALFFFQYAAAGVGAYLRGKDMGNYTLTQLQAISGNITVKIDGVDKTASNVGLSGATSFSNAASIIATALGATVEFDTQLQAFEIHSSTTGESSIIEAATGTLATALGLTTAKGVTISQGTDAESPTEVMNAVKNATQNWGSFTTIDEQTIENKKLFSEWSNAQGSRYVYVPWGFEVGADVSGNTTCLGVYLNDNKFNGTAPVYGGLDKASFVCGAIASIDFTQTNGRITFAFKGQSGLTFDVTNETTALNLKANGYNFYGNWATANDKFVFLYNGQIAGKWEWLDAFVNQIRLNSQFQLALMTLLTSAKSVPYNALGIALQRAACQDPINEALNFGSIRAGVVLSEQQKAIINSACGFDAASQVESNGYYLLIQQASAQTRANRASMPMSFWYTDGGSVHSIVLESINVQ